MLRSSSRPAILLAALVLSAGCGSSSTDSSTAPATDAAAGTTTTAAPATTTTTTTTTAPTTTSTSTSTTAAPTTTEPVAEPGDALFDAATITLLDAGAEPRQELRYEIADGTYAMQTDQRQAIRQEIDGELLVDAVTETRIVADLDVERREDGYEYRTTLVEAELVETSDPASAEMTEMALGSMIGVSTVEEIDVNGQRTRAPIMEGAEGLPAEMVQTMDVASSISSGLPSEPVGVGARWTIGQRISLGSVSVYQTSEWELLEIDGSRLTVRYTGTQELEGDTLDAGAGAELDVILWDVEVSGGGVIDLTRPVPEMTALTTLIQELAVRGLDGTLRQSLEMEMTVSAPTAAS